MEKDDARKLSSAEQHERRRQAIRAYQRGRTRTQIAEDVGLSYTAVGKIIALYESSGVAALAPRLRGRRGGEGRVLTPTQEDRIHRTICDSSPRQVGLAFAAWSRPAVQQLIERECDVELHVRSVGKYLARWGFEPQRSVKSSMTRSAAAAMSVDTRHHDVVPVGNEAPIANAFAVAQAKA